MQTKWPFFLWLEPSYLQVCSVRTCRPWPALGSCLWLYGWKPNSTSTPIFPQNKTIFSNSMEEKKKPKTSQSCSIISGFEKGRHWADIQGSSKAQWIEKPELFLFPQVLLTCKWPWAVTSLCFGSPIFVRRIITLHDDFRLTEELSCVWDGHFLYLPKLKAFGVKDGQDLVNALLFLKLWEIEKKLWLSDSLLSTVSQNMFSC